MLYRVDPRTNVPQYPIYPVCRYPSSTNVNNTKTKKYLAELKAILKPNGDWSDWFGLTGLTAVVPSV